MTISAEVVRDLREKTGAGMMDCKKALSESGGDMEKALDLLRKRGIAIAAKKAGRTACEGLIGLVTGNDFITMAEINCETDFVCKTDDFQKFVKDVVDHISKTKPSDVDSVLNSTMGGKKAGDIITALIAKIGENIAVRRFVTKKTAGLKNGCYVHAGSKIGVVVLFDDPSNKLTNELAKDVAMHVAAMNPQYVRKSDVPQAVLAKEREICAAQMANEKKPPEILDKIVTGKVNKYLSEICLEDQIFVKDPTGKSSVAQALTKLDSAIKIKEFVRYQVGEGLK